MTPDLIKLRELLDASTPGPWASPNPPDGPGEGMVWGGDGITICSMYFITDETIERSKRWGEPLTRPEGQHIFDAAFIVAAVNATPYLLSRFERLVKAGDGLALAGGSRNAGNSGPERDERNRRNWYKASVEWSEAKRNLVGAGGG